MSNNSDDLYLEKMLPLVMDSIPIRVFWKDTNSIFLGANQLFLNDANLKHIDEIIGKSDYDMCWSKQESDNFRKDDQQVITSGQAKIGIEESKRLPDGSVSWILTNKVPLKNKAGKIIGLVGTYKDITKQVHYREEIEIQALIDPLTNLANRRQLHNTIANFKGDYAGLMFIDLDYFKTINDSLGHSIGDQLLKLVAQRLQYIVGNKGIVARLGGDEFSVFMPLLVKAKAENKLAMFAKTIISALLTPFKLDNHILNLSASIGITVIGKNNPKLDDKFREADIAMYAAKARGRNNFQFYDQSMREKVERDHLLQNNLRQAISKNEFFLLYQPQVNAAGNLIGVEALLRWKNNDLGHVSSDDFISLIEKTGLIHTVGLWVLEKGLDTLVSWADIIDTRGSDFKLAINVSSKQFQNREFVSQIKQAIDKRNVNPENIQIEITESLFIEHEEIAIESMLKLKKMGISLAVDDFGTGYSSFSYLTNLPIDKLKIDQSFITKLNTKEKNKKLVSTLISMAKNLDMEIIAEGVENEKERQTLINLGCEQFQGFFFSEPVDAKGITDFYLNNYDRKT